MTSTLRRVYHITAFSWYAFIVKSLAAKDGEELPPGIFVYGGPWKYLTFLNLLLQMTFFGLATVNDLQPGKKSESTLNRCKDLLFSVFAFPVGMFVVLLFWTIFAYDRELVYPATIDTFFPPWMNHAMTNRLRNSFYPGAVASITTLPQSNDEGTLVERVLNICTQHTFVLPVLLGEVLVQPHTYPQTKHALAALGVVGLSYLFWIVWVYLSVGIWVYPLLGHFSTNGLMGFFFFNMSVVTLLYVLGDKLNSHVWSKGRTRMTTKAK